MNRRQYDREMESIIAGLKGRRPSLLLHSCCGPCSSACLERLTPHFDVTVYYYNPNILPAEEFDKRVYWQKELLRRAPFADGVELIVPEQSPEEFFAVARGMEQLPEGGKRCAACFRLRLEKTARAAREGGYDYFATTLTVSRHKNSLLINGICEEEAEKAGVLWLPSDFKKRGGSDRSSFLANEYGLYQQKWCGCGWPGKDKA